MLRTADGGNADCIKVSVQQKSHSPLMYGTVRSCATGLPCTVTLLLISTAVT